MCSLCRCPTKKKIMDAVSTKRDFDEENNRTIFVSNLPLSHREKQLKRLFREFGPIESVRFRNIAVSNLTLSKKIAFIKSKLHEKRKSLNAYVRFTSEASARSALAVNGRLVDGHHVFVDTAVGQKRDQKNAIFLGNLPLAAEEEDLWRLFESCGSIENIRVVRDNATGVCTGIGYVNFASRDSVELALQMTRVELKQHLLRIKRWQRPRKPQKNDFKKKKYKKPLDRILELENAKRPTTKQSLGSGAKANDRKKSKTFVGRKFNEKKKTISTKKKTNRKHKQKLIEVLNKN